MGLVLNTLNCQAGSSHESSITAGIQAQNLPLLLLLG